MPPIEALPPDQRAVLELVLRRGRTYDEIAQLLSIDRAGVRQRALSALDALGPEADVPPERRALITDYLLGALPPRVAEQVRTRLAQVPAERAWARVVGAELEPIASRPLPEIPTDGAGAGRRGPAAAAPAAPQERPAPERAARPSRVPASPPEEEDRPRRGARREGGRKGLLGPRPPLEPGRERPSSRRAGKMVLIAAAIIILVIILSVVLGGGGKSHKTASVAKGSTGTTTSTSSSTTSTGSGSRSASTSSGEKILAQVNLRPPSGGSSPAGIAEILKAGSTRAVAILAQHLQPNKAHNAYAVWLENSPSDAQLLGFVNPAVTSNGKLQAESPLPSTASRFHHLLVTVETQAKPKSPGPIVLEGTLTGIS